MIDVQKNDGGKDKTRNKRNEKFIFILKESFREAITLISRISKSRTATISIIILFIWFVMALFGPSIVPHDPNNHKLDVRFNPPSLEHLFGTDRYGRDVFSRVIVGSRTVLLLAASATSLSLVLGTIIGLTSGYFGKIYDEVIMRFMDILMSFPALLFAMMILGIFGQNFLGVVVVIGVVFAPRIARVVRSSVLDLKNQEFVEAAKVRGETSFYIMFVEIFPNTLGTLGVEAAIRFGYAIFMSSSLGFLGLGVQPPTPDWGLMMNDAQQHISIAPWMTIFPALAIASLTVSVNFLSDTIRKLESGDL